MMVLGTQKEMIGAHSASWANAPTYKVPKTHSISLGCKARDVARCHDRQMPDGSLNNLLPTPGMRRTCDPPMDVSI